MSRRRNEYIGYRGRLSASDVLKTIAIVLAVLVAIAVGILIYAQRFLVYSEDGPRLELPFFQREEQEEQPPVPVEVDVVEAADPEPEPEPEPEPAGPRTALQLPPDTVTNGSAVQLLAEAGAEVLVLEMKPPQGVLNWVSQAELAQKYRVTGTDPAMNDALRTLNEQEGVYTVARVSCLRDNTLPYRFHEVAVHADYGNWVDDVFTRWLNPTNPEVQSYLTALCVELAELGFDELLLENCAYPTKGETWLINNLNYTQAESSLQGPSGLLTRIGAALEPYGTRLSLRLSGPLSAETAPGLTEEGVTRLFRSLWLPRPAEGGYSLDRLETVYLVPELTPDSPDSLAVLTESAIKQPRK